MYSPSKRRYDSMTYRRCGVSGLDLPVISLGLWNNFGDDHLAATQRDVVLRAFDLGVTHFDLANNYGPPPGAAETRLGEILHDDLGSWRDEMVISTKAGYEMGPGPYQVGGSRKYLLSSLDQSLRRMKLDYVDIFYSHRPDTTTPMIETMGALASAVSSGKALYAGISNYSAQQTAEAVVAAREVGLRLLIHQPSYSMFNRWAEEPQSTEANAAPLSLLDLLAKEGVGAIAYSPLQQGLLTGRYLNGVPADSRAASGVFLHESDISERYLTVARSLTGIAEARGQSLAQLALTWALRDSRMTSVIIGASSVKQLEENIAAAAAPELSAAELAQIDRVVADFG